jgi:hypothetical protein
MAARKLVSTVHHSTQITKKIAHVRAQRDEKASTVVQDVDTRWSSTFAMAKSLNILQPDLSTVMNSAEVNDACITEISLANEERIRNVMGEDDSADEAPLSEGAETDLLKVPRDFMLLDSQFYTMRCLEGFSSPASEVTLMLEGKLYIMGNKGYPALKILHATYSDSKLIVPGQLTSSEKSADRRWYSYDYDGLPLCVRQAKAMMLKQLEQRFFEEEPNKKDLAQIFMDPTIKPALIHLVGEAAALKARQYVQESCKQRMPS